MSSVCMLVQLPSGGLPALRLCTVGFQHGAKRHISQNWNLVWSKIFCGWCTFSCRCHQVTILFWGYIFVSDNLLLCLWHTLSFQLNLYHEANNLKEVSVWEYSYPFFLSPSRRWTKANVTHLFPFKFHTLWVIQISINCYSTSECLCLRFFFFLVCFILKYFISIPFN